MSPRDFKLSPSDFAFLWEECKRCFYLKVARGFARPPMPFPRVFHTIDAGMKEFFNGRRSETLAPGAPAGVVKFGDGWVESRAVTFPGLAPACHIRGIFDAVIELDGGGFAVVDFKTTDLKSDHAKKYSRQLHAYALALENPAPSAMALGPVRKLGLLIYAPASFRQEGPDSALLEGKLAWREIPRDDAGFRGFLESVVALLECADPPPADPECRMCRYRNDSRATGW